MGTLQQYRAGNPGGAPDVETNEIKDHSPAAGG